MLGPELGLEGPDSCSTVPGDAAPGMLDPLRELHCIRPLAKGGQQAAGREKGSWCSVGKERGQEPHVLLRTRWGDASVLTALTHGLRGRGTGGLDTESGRQTL